MLDFDTCNEARLRRDPAYDGKFFTAVRTTKIYCRPVCPVKHPLTKNVSYYPTAAAAERAGYRPCLRCRPETAPFCAAWKGTRTTVERALKLIEEGALNMAAWKSWPSAWVSAQGTCHGFSRTTLAHRRLQTGQTLRIGRAKRLLDETNLPITDVAFKAGFGSVRRFNAAFQKLYGRPPSSIRRPKN